MDKFKYIDLDDRAFHFVEEFISRGGLLSRMLLDGIRSRVQRIWTILPLLANENYLYEFERGYICELDSSEELSELVNKRLQADSQARWILIDNVGHTNAPMIQASIRGITVPFRFEGELLQMLNRSLTTTAAIHETFVHGGAYPFVGFVTRVDDEMSITIGNNKLTCQDVLRLVSEIDFLIVGAYDEESYLVLELAQV